MNWIFLQSMLQPHSDQAERISVIFNQFNIAAFSMLALVSILTTFIVIKYRKKKNQQELPKQIKGNGKVEALMIGIPTLLVLFFFFRSLAVMRSLNVNDDDLSETPDIIITAHQFWWEATYPASGLTVANEIHLPAGKKLLVELHSADVIHDWWVPSLGRKMDMIPNRKNYTWITIKKPGKYIGACSEFCGAQHAWMRINVIAQDSAGFQNWMAANSRPAVGPADSLSALGAAVFQSSTCADCHRIQGTVANASVGPDLTHLSSRTEMLAGMLPVTESNLLHWISDPQEIKPGAHMPAYIFSQDTLNAIAHYMAQLK